jgi:hypothetical protein
VIFRHASSEHLFEQTAVRPGCFTGAKTMTDDRAEEKRIWRMVRDRGFALDEVRQLYWLTAIR